MNFRRLFKNFFGHRVPIASDLAPDEIFLDSSNLPRFDRHRFEGRLERPIPKFLLVGLGVLFFVIGLIYLTRLLMLQVVEGSTYQELSENNRLAHVVIIADRGVVYDRTGEELVWNTPTEEFEFSHRTYADISGLSHLLGYVSYPKRDTSGFFYQTEFIGLEGVERSFDESLQGINGLKLVEINALGEVQSESTIDPPQIGDNLTLSVDSAMTAALHMSLARVADEIGYTGGAGVVMDVRTGEVIALTSYPEYHISALTSGEEEEIAKLREDSRTPFLNRAIAGLYAPGSIVKPYVAVGALEENIIAPEKEILSTGALSLPNPYNPGQFSVFRDWRAHGYVDMRRALAVSSDVYFYEVGGGFESQAGLGISRLEQYFRLFGLGKRTGIELAGEKEGTIPSPVWKAEVFDGDIWRVGDTYNTAIGQYGMQVTPLQMARGIAAIANSGRLISPVLRLGDLGSSEELPIEQEHLTIVREGMRKAVTEGTATALYFPEFEVAAKTGTAEVGTRKQFINAWVVGFFPYDNPRYSFAFMLERAPAGNLVGATAAARSFFEWMYANRPEYLQL